MPPQRLSHRLDEIAGLADALAIVSENDGDRSKHSNGAVANDMSRRLDALYGEEHDALEDPPRFLGCGLGSERDRGLDRHGAVPIIASALAARHFGWRNVITTSVLAALMILGIIGAWIDLHLPE